jgi:hypothetical protein
VCFGNNKGLFKSFTCRRHDCFRNFRKSLRFATEFAKGVVKKITGRIQARREQVIREASEGLQNHASAAKRLDDRYMHLTLSRRKGRTDLEKKDYDLCLKSLRNQRDGARIAAKECWNILERRDALPIDPVTRKQWVEFYDFLKKVDVSEAEAMRA